MTRCKICRAPFQKRSIAHKVCGNPDCAEQWVKMVRERKARKGLREDKLRAKTRAQWLREAQAAFNAWVRFRDRGEPCISCGRHHTGQIHASHYRSVGACPELRFEPLNVWASCAPCNNHLSGNIVEYRIRLVEKIGLARVEWLEGKHAPTKYTISDAIAIKVLYKAKLTEEDAV